MVIVAKNCFFINNFNFCNLKFCLCDSSFGARPLSVQTGFKKINTDDFFYLISFLIVIIYFDCNYKIKK